VSSRVATRIKAESAPALSFTRAPQRILQRKCACGGTVAAGGECAQCRKKRLQTKLAVNQPGDRFEQEADRMADFVVHGRRHAPALSSYSLGSLQRDEPKTAPKPDNYDEAISKILDALKETPVAKELQAKAAEMGKDFISSVEGKVIAGSALGGALGAIIATNSKLPMQIPELPLDFIAPGLKAKITWEGPTQSPTNAGLVLTTKSGVSVGASYTKTPASGGKPAEEKAGLTLTIPLGGSSEKKKGGPTASEKYRAETAKIAAEQEKFRAGMKTPGEKTDDKDLVDAYVRSKIDPTNPLGLPPLKKKEDLLLMRKVPNESLAAPAIAPPIVDDVLAQTGQPLDRATRSFMEGRFGYDFSRVRVHSDTRDNASARSVHAHAYTVGENIVFDAGRFAPHTREGRRLLAHELTHVVQQGAATGMLQRKINIEDFEGGNFDRKTLDTYIANFGPGKIEDHNDSDDKARTITALWRKGRFTLTPEKKILLIQEMQSGFTGDDDERAILTLLFNSSDAELQVIFNPKNGIDPKDLDSDFQGPEEDELRGFYDRKFEGARAAALKGSRKLKVAQPTAQQQTAPPPKPQRVPRTGEADVVVLLDPAIKALADTLAPGAEVLKPASPAAMAKALKGIKHPIKTLFILSHSLDNASIGFGHQFVLPQNLATELKDSIAQGLEPDLIDFRGCRIGMTPPGMELIRAALNAGAAVGGTCWMLTLANGPFDLGDGEVVSPKRPKSYTTAEYNKGLEFTLKSFGPARKCVLSATLNSYFAAGGKLVAAWYTPRRATEFDPLYSKCYTEITPKTVNPAEVAKAQSSTSHDCQLIRVEKKP
jgi:hypothetical protein